MTTRRNLTRALRRSDIHRVGVPISQLVLPEFPNPKHRALFKNIVYLGAMSALISIDFDVITGMVSAQYKGKDDLIAPNIHALEIGRNYTLNYLDCPLPIQVRYSDAVGDRIMVDGNAAAALGAIYGGATVCAWYPITPSTSLAEAFEKYCNQLRVGKDGERNFAIVQAEDELAAMGIVIGAGWNGARAFTATSGPGVSLMDRIPRPRLFCGDPGGTVGHPAYRAVNGHADTHAAGRSPGRGLRFPWRHPPPAIVPLDAEGVLRIRGGCARSRRQATDPDHRAIGSRTRHERQSVRAVRVGRIAAFRSRQGPRRRST